MTAKLRCYSFHSVKGGVGKSTLSVVTALALAHEHPEAPVYLIDMDLTGTSLADVLPLEAPRWEGVEDGAPLNLRTQPADFHDHERSRGLVEAREDAEGSAPIGVPFLNDYLLFQTPDWDEEADVPPVSIAWRLRGGPGNLRVFPSSALPRDLERALPVIYDEEHAAYLEGRLEYLLAALVSEDQDVFVVFDTPPTIPGLSRSVLSLALRLPLEPKTTLADDESMPHSLREAKVIWRAYVVTTQDYQDIRAAERWLRLTPDTGIVRPVLNRAEGQDEHRRQLLLRALREPASSGAAPAPEDPEATARPGSRMTTAIWIEETKVLQQIFRGEEAPPVLRDLLLRLDENGGA